MFLFNWNYYVYAFAEGSDGGGGGGNDETPTLRDSFRQQSLMINHSGGIGSILFISVSVRVCILCTYRMFNIVAYWLLACVWNS